MGSKSSHNKSDNVFTESGLPDDFEDIVGSDYYISPEMIERRQYSYASDLWAVGIILFRFYTGVVPFKGKTQDETFELIKKCELTIPSDVPKQACDLIKSLIVKNPELRLGSTNIDDVKNHKYFDGINWSYISSQAPPIKFELS